jgi:hypothetical protein
MNDIPCGVCGENTAAGFVQCDEPYVAPHGYHANCLDPPVTEEELATGDWRCPAHEPCPVLPPLKRRKRLNYLVLPPASERKNLKLSLPLPPATPAVTAAAPVSAMTFSAVAAAAAEAAWMERTFAAEAESERSLADRLRAAAPCSEIEKRFSGFPVGLSRSHFAELIRSQAFKG